MRKKRFRYHYQAGGSERRAEELSLYKRKKKWWMDIRINEIRKRLLTGTENKKLAEDIHAKTLMDIREGRWFPSEAKRRTFVELKERYMNEHSRINKTPK